MLTKAKVLQTVQQLPDQFDLEELIDQLILIEKVEVGLQQAREGKKLSLEEAKERLKKWQK